MTFWTWSGDELSSEVAPAPGVLLVADSFRLSEGQIRGRSLHEDRFAASAAAALAAHGMPALSRDEIARFTAAAGAVLAGGDELFPRLELWRCPNGARLSVRSRPLPALGESVAVRCAGADPRVSPTIKGPNITALTTLGVALGAEPLLLDADCAVVEGGTTSLLWWEEGTLLAVANRSRVDSVTERLVLAAAAAAGVPVRLGARSPGELVAHETWALNSLHGIRPVITIDGAAAPEPDPARLAAFRAALDRTWEPFPA